MRSFLIRPAPPLFEEAELLLSPMLKPVLRQPRRSDRGLAQEASS